MCFFIYLFILFFCYTVAVWVKPCSHKLQSSTKGNQAKLDWARKLQYMSLRTFLRLLAKLYF